MLGIGGNIQKLELRVDLKRNPRRFWKFFKDSKKKSNLNNISDWSKYFSDLLAEDEKSATLFVPSADDVNIVFPHPTTYQINMARQLNTEFTHEEVEGAIESMIRNKAAGICPIVAEWLKYARAPGTTGAESNLLCNSITLLFNGVMKEGYIFGWASGALVPVPKPKGRH